jgi:superfamily II DNA/RNA helicase
MPLFIHNTQPDTIISIFNSPFGPDVLVVTDKLSEGIDLHRYCRHLIHYELDPSPIRTVQRNGRIRRVNSWAAVSGKPVMYAYPAFGGTRDLRLVQIMKKRIDSFSLLLGGVPDFDVEELVGSEEHWRNEVIAIAKCHLRESGVQLRARDPGQGPEFTHPWTPGSPQNPPSGTANGRAAISARMSFRLAAASQRRHTFWRRVTTFEMETSARSLPLFRYQRVMPDSTPRSFNHRRLVSFIRQICVLQDNYLEVRCQFRTHRE